MIHVVYDDVVTAFCIHRGGRENVENGGGAGFKLTEIRLFFAKEHPLQKRLFFDLIFRRLFFLSGLLWNCFCSFFGFFFTCIVLLLINAVNGRCHIENALRQTHTLAGFLVQNLIEQLEHKIIGILRLQYLQFT